MSGPTRTAKVADLCAPSPPRGGHPGWQHRSYTNKWPGTSVGSWIDRAPGLTIHKDDPNNATFPNGLTARPKWQAERKEQNDWD